jgi:hypothetical protein
MMIYLKQNLFKLLMKSEDQEEEEEEEEEEDQDYK